MSTSTTGSWRDRPVALVGHDVHLAFLRIEPAVQFQSLDPSIPAAQAQVHGLQIHFVEYGIDGAGGHRGRYPDELAEGLPRELMGFVAQQFFPCRSQELERAAEMRASEQDF